MPLGGGSAAAFNGGTITLPLVIDNADDDVNAALRVIAGSTNTVGVVLVVDPATSAVTVQGLDNVGRVRVTDDFSSSSAQIDSGGSGRFTGGSVIREDVGGANYTALTANGLTTAVHAAVADGDVTAGEVYLWFDQTNGAAKLMLKGKTADGTVVAAAIALA